MEEVGRVGGEGELVVAFSGAGVQNQLAITMRSLQKSMASVTDMLTAQGEENLSLQQKIVRIEEGRAEDQRVALAQQEESLRIIRELSEKVDQLSRKNALLEKREEEGDKERGELKMRLGKLEFKHDRHSHRTWPSPGVSYRWVDRPTIANWEKTH